jgi:hypothetical protein
MTVEIGEVETEHVHDFGLHGVDTGRPDGSLTMVGEDCACGRCPRGICDGTGVPEPGWTQEDPK